MNSYADAPYKLLVVPVPAKSKVFGTKTLELMHPFRRLRGTAGRPLVHATHTPRFH